MGLVLGTPGLVKWEWQNPLLPAALLILRTKEETKKASQGYGQGLQVKG